LDLGQQGSIGRQVLKRALPFRHEESAVWELSHGPGKAKLTIELGYPSPLT